MFKAGYRSTPRPRQQRAMSLVSGNPMQRKADARLCAHPDCVTVLSKYNPSGTCAEHGGWTVPAEPGKRQRRHTI